MSSSQEQRFILLVEDNEDLRSLYCRAMMLEGFAVATAANGREALNILHMASRLPDLIFLDLMMPVMDGWQFLDARAKHNEWSCIPVIVCSAYQDRAPQNVEFIAKPADLTTLLGAAKRYLNKSCG